MRNANAGKKAMLVFLATVLALFISACDVRTKEEKAAYNRKIKYY